MQLTNSLVTICCNNILSVTGGDIYISVMTIISSVRQLVETLIHAMVEGTSLILSYNYGACRPGRVRKSILISESPCFRLHGRRVEHDHPHPGNADPYFQLGRGADPGCSSGAEHVFCSFYLYGPPVHRSGGI